MRAAIDWTQQQQVFISRAQDGASYPLRILVRPLGEGYVPGKKPPPPDDCTDDSGVREVIDRYVELRGNDLMIGLFKIYRFTPPAEMQDDWMLSFVMSVSAEGRYTRSLGAWGHSNLFDKSPEAAQ